MSIALLVVAKCFSFQKESRPNKAMLIFRLLCFFYVHWHFQNLETVLLILKATTSAPFIPALYHLTHHVLIEKKNIPVSNKSEIHQGPQSVHSPFLVQIVLHSAAQQMHFVHKCQWIKHFRSFFQGGNWVHFFRVLKIYNKEKSSTIDFQARRRKICITIVVSKQDFNIVKGL